MFKYMYKDMMSMLRFVPLGVLFWVLAVGLILWINGRRVRKGKDKLSVFSTSCFYMYVMILFTITFFSRENGSGEGLDLQLFSTWGINARNNAYVIENILLFIPYGFFGALSARGLRNVFGCMGISFLTSLGIELLQFLSHRGVFQIDDILTNVVGSLAGLLLARILRSIFHAR